MSVFALNDYDKHEKVASTNQGDLVPYSLYIIKWGKMYRFALGDMEQGFNTVGEIFETKAEYITKAFDYALTQGFTKDEIVQGFKPEKEKNLANFKKDLKNLLIEYDAYLSFECMESMEQPSIEVTLSDTVISHELCKDFELNVTNFID